jgi:hypothetical protein
VSLGTRLLVVEWNAYRRDILQVKKLRDAILADTVTIGIPLRVLLDGQLALARGDSAAAAESFRSLRVNVPTVQLEWELVQPLPLERLVLARQALAHGDAAEAIWYAAVFDHPAPVAYLPFVAAGLDIRLDAARKLGRRDLVAAYQSRIGRLQAGAGVALGRRR